MNVSPSDVPLKSVQLDRRELTGRPWRDRPATSQRLFNHELHRPLARHRSAVERPDDNGQSVLKPSVGRRPADDVVPADPLPWPSVGPRPKDLPDVLVYPPQPEHWSCPGLVPVSFEQYLL